jgi:integrase
MQAALTAAAYNLTGETSRRDGLPWHRLRHDEMRLLRRELAERYAPATVNRILSGLRGVLRACYELRYMSLEEPMSASNILPVPKYWPSGEQGIWIDALVEGCITDSRPAGQRDQALLALLSGAGLRTSEVVNLDRGDYSLAIRRLTIRQSKGNTTSQLSVSRKIAGILDRWLLIRGREQGPFFVPIRKSGRPQSRRLTTRAITWIVQQRAIESNVPLVSLRDIRRHHPLSMSRVTAIPTPPHRTNG